MQDSLRSYHESSDDDSSIQDMPLLSDKEESKEATSLYCNAESGVDMDPVASKVVRLLPSLLESHGFDPSSLRISIRTLEDSDLVSGPDQLLDAEEIEQTQAIDYEKVSSSDDASLPRESHSDYEEIDPSDELKMTTSTRIWRNGEEDFATVPDTLESIAKMMRLRGMNPRKLRLNVVNTSQTDDDTHELLDTDEEEVVEQIQAVEGGETLERTKKIIQMAKDAALLVVRKSATLAITEPLSKSVKSALGGNPKETGEFYFAFFAELVAHESAIVFSK